MSEPRVGAASPGLTRRAETATVRASASANVDRLNTAAASFDWSFGSGRDHVGGQDGAFGRSLAGRSGRAQWPEGPQGLPAAELVIRLLVPLRHPVAHGVEPRH